MFKTDGFKFPKPRLPPNHEACAPRKPRASCSRRGGHNCSYAHDGSSSRGSNLTFAPSISGTLPSAGISRNSYSSGQSSHQGSQDDMEADFEKGITERMESLVSSLLQDEGQEECQDNISGHLSEVSITERMESLVSGLLQDEGQEECQDNISGHLSEVSSGGSNNVSSSRDLSAEAARRIQELQLQYQDQREDQEFASDGVRRKKVLAGGRFSSTEIVFPCKETRHQMLKAQESAIHRESCSEFPADKVKLSSFSYSQKNVCKNTNPKTIHEFQEHMANITLRQYVERAYAVQKELEEMEARDRENATELQIMDIIEAMRAANVYTDSVAGIGQLVQGENLCYQEDLVQELRAIANSIEQNSLFERNKPHKGLCECICQQGFSSPRTELENLRKDVGEVNRLRLHVENVDSTQSCSSAGHVRSQRTFEQGFSSPRSTSVNNNSPCHAPAASFNSSGAVVQSAASGPLSGGGRQETPCVRSRLRNTPGIDPDGYLCNSESPTKRKTSPKYSDAVTFHPRSSTKAIPPVMGAQNINTFHPRSSTNAIPPVMGAQNINTFHPRSSTNAIPPVMGAQNINTFHPRSSTNAIPPVMGAQNINTEIPSIYSAKSEYHSFQKLLPKQKGSAYHATFAGQDTGSKDSSMIRHKKSPATKAVIAQGAKSISVLLRPENSASRGRSSNPPSSGLNGSILVSTGSGLLSSLRRRQLNNSEANVSNESSSELDVGNQGQCKTELCNSWQATQYCHYGDLCRFAHGVEQLRCVLRHPRYKTRPCRMILNGKSCIYGHRCHFRHSLTTQELSLIAVVDVHKASVHDRNL